MKDFYERNYNLFIITPFLVIIDECFAMHVVISLSSIKGKKKINTKKPSVGIYLGQETCQEWINEVYNYDVYNIKSLSLTQHVVKLDLLIMK